MPVRLEVDPALGGIDPAQIEALLPKELTDRLAADEEKLGLEELLYALGLHDWRKRLDQLAGGGQGWGLHLAAVAVATLFALLVASCWLLRGGTEKRVGHHTREVETEAEAEIEVEGEGVGEKK